MPKLLVALVASVAVASLACRRDRAPDPGEAVSETRLTRAELPVRSDQPRPGTSATVEVERDRSVLVVIGAPSVSRPIVYLHGMCAEPRDDLEAWGAVAEEAGTIVGLRGDVACPDKPGRTKWSDDLEELDQRITTAITAVNGAGLTPPLSTDELIVIGESMGAARAESLAAVAPARYARLVLVGSPRTPSPSGLARARAVATLAGDREPQSAMREGARALDRAGIASQFYSLPGATHGQYGADGERIMREALRFVASR